MGRVGDKNAGQGFDEGSSSPIGRGRIDDAEVLQSWMAISNGFGDELAPESPDRESPPMGKERKKRVMRQAVCRHYS